MSSRIARRWAKCCAPRATTSSTGGTDTHLILLDLRPKKLTGNIAEKSLGRAHITCNKNGVPFDPEKPTVTSGVRLGTPAGTTRGFGVAEFREIGRMIVEVLDGLAVNGEAGNADIESKVKAQAIRLVRAVSNLSVTDVTADTMTKN